VPPLPLVPLAVAGALGGFLAGRMFGQPEAGGGPAIAGGEGSPAPDSSLAGASGDVWDSWGTASLNFAGSEGVGELAGVLPIPPSPFVQPPAPAPTPTPMPAPMPAPSPTRYPAGAVAKIVATRIKNVWVLSNGVLVKHSYSAGFTFWGYIGPWASMRTSTGATATFARIVWASQSSMIGRYVHSGEPGLTVTKL
jgi:hypothetical protein